MTNCPHCGKLVDPHLDNCPYCGGFLRARQPSAAKQERAQSQTCPACGALVQPGDIICVACGTNLLTGQRVTEERRPAKQRRSFEMNWTVAGAILGGIIILAIAIAAVFLLTRDPLAQAQRLAAEGNTQEAITILEEVVADNQNNLRAQEALGELYWQTERYNEAAAALEQVATMEPSRRDAAMLALVSLASAPGSRNYERESAILERVVQHHPDDANAWYLLALSRGARGDVEGEIEALERVIQIDGSNMTTIQSLGVARALQGRTEEASTNLRSALAAQPGDGDALAAMGTVELRNGDVASAEESFQGALNAGTTVAAEAHLQLGLLYIQQARYDEALEHLNAVIQTTEEYPAARYYRAVAQRQRGLVEEALQELDGIVRRGGPYAQEAALETARIHLDGDELELAQTAIGRAEQIGATGPAYYTIKGRASAMEGEDIAAQDFFKRAITSDPNYAPAYLEHGLVYVRRGLFKEGITALNRYLELADPTLPGARVNEVRTLIEQLETSIGQRT